MSGPEMEYNYLGKTGLKVSAICLGTMTFGKHKGGYCDFFNTPTHSDEEMAAALLERFVELGGNFIDTANNYSAGRSEAVIGNWIESRGGREDFVLATKCRYPTLHGGKDPNDQGLSRRQIIQSLTQSLERLKTDHIDLYQAHGWDNATPIEETLRTFDDLVRNGKIRYYGYSNVCGWQMQKIAEVAKYTGLNPCASLQQQYSLLHRGSEMEAFMVCENEGICVLPWSPLTGGLLTGKFTKGEIPDSDKSRLGFMNSKNAVGQLGAWATYSEDEKYWNIVQALKDTARQIEGTPAQVALRWLLEKPIVPSVIIGATSIQQLEENMAAGSRIMLTPSQMQALDDVSDTSKIYPYNMLWNAKNASRYNKYHSGSVKMPY